MNTIAGILHKMDIFVAYESMPSIVDKEIKMNTLPGLIHKLDADIINIIHKRNPFIDYYSMPSILDINQKSYEAIKAFENGDAVYVNNIEVLGYSNQAFLGRDKIIPYSIVTSVTTIS